MLIDLASVGTSSKQLELSFESQKIDLEGEALIEESVGLSAEIVRVGSRTRLSGTIKANVLVSCTRCLESIRREFDIAFQDIFVDASEESTREEAEVGTEELDESLITSGEIDLTEVVREQILLELPKQIFCKEDCRGLCPKCGGNLNLIDCNCIDDEIDPRWAALQNLK